MSIHHRNTFSGIGRADLNRSTSDKRVTVMLSRNITGRGRRRKNRRFLIRADPALPLFARRSIVAGFRLFSFHQFDASARERREIPVIYTHPPAVSPSLPRLPSSAKVPVLELERSRDSSLGEEREMRGGGGFVCSYKPESRIARARRPAARDIFRYVNKYKVDRRSAFLGYKGLGETACA